jgi:hypothetical protein
MWFGHAEKWMTGELSVYFLNSIIQRAPRKTAENIGRLIFNMIEICNNMAYISVFTHTHTHTHNYIYICSQIVRKYMYYLKIVADREVTTDITLMVVYTHSFTR